MREILFRGKRIDNGDWVSSGNLITFNDEGEGKMFFIPEQNAKCTCTHNDQDNILSFNSGVFYKVDSLTVGQFTGLTDKNGKKIFEGDIVKHYHDSQFPESYSKGVVFYDEELCRWKRTSENIKCCIDNRCVYEVIGNIHDNPELVEVDHA